MALSAAPGLYAVLVGSGLSSAAGIPTGWQVVRDLILQVARADGVDLEASGQSPEQWWDETRGTEPRYDVLLSQLAPTDLSRRALLSRYFDPPAGADGLLQPTAAHTALARLCAESKIRVILTVNFDPLIERALDQAGISPQVVRNPNTIAGMIPVQHAPVTVVKLHGDYTEPGMRNSPDELREYPKVLHDLIVRVVDEYGLLVVGWSADWDLALCTAVEEGTSRRYPTYWATYRDKVTDKARSLMTWRDAVEIPTLGAEEFLPDLAARVRQLDSRTARQSQPRQLRTIWSAPTDSTPPAGWRFLPLLSLTGTVGIEARLDDCGYIREPQRASIQRALLTAPLTARLHGLAGEKPQSASDAAEAEDATPTPLGVWRVIEGDNQTTGHASYRAGTDATHGTSAHLDIWFPNQGQGALITIGIHVGLSIERRIALSELAFLWRDMLTLTSTALAEAIATILPGYAEPTLASIYALAAPTDGHQSKRENTLADRINLTQLGAMTAALPTRLGQASSIDGSLTAYDAAVLVADSLSIIAYDAGFIAPEAGLTNVRQATGVHWARVQATPLFRSSEARVRDAK